MIIIFDILAPIFALVLMGYVLAKKQYITLQIENGLSYFVFNIAVPMMLFNIIAQVKLPEKPPIDYFLTYYGALFFAAICAFLGIKFIFKRDYVVQVIAGFCASFGNTVFLGLPLLLLMFGEDRIVPFYILLSVHGLTLFTIVTILLEYGTQELDSDIKQKNKNIQIIKQTLLSLVKNPLLIGIISGLLINLFSLPLPKVLISMTGLMKGAVVPVALLVLGASLTRYGIRGRLGESFMIVTLKLVIFPYIVYVVGKNIFNIDPLWLAIAVIMAGQPSGIMGYVFARKYGVGEATASTSIFLGSVMSIFTLSWIVFYFQDLQ